MTYHYEPEELAHSTHPHTCSRGDPSKPTPMIAQDGWVYQTLFTTSGVAYDVRLPNVVQIQPEWIDLPCQYSNHRTDPACKHCPRKDT